MGDYLSVGIFTPVRSLMGRWSYGAWTMDGNLPVAEMFWREIDDSTRLDSTSSPSWQRFGGKLIFVVDATTTNDDDDDRWRQ